MRGGAALPARLHGRALVVARTAWLVAVGGSLAASAAGLVRGFRQPELVAPQAVVALTADIDLALRLLLAAVVIPLVGVTVVSAVVFWRRSTDPMALLFTAALVAPFVVSSRSLLAFADDPALAPIVPVVATFALVCLVLVLAVFPNGRFVPSWTVFLAPAMGVLMLAFPQAGEVVMRMPDVAPDVTFWPTGAIVVAWCALMLLGLAAQAYRYRRVSDATERLQTKWVMAPLGLLFTFGVVALFLPATLDVVSQRWLGWGIVAALCISVAVPPMLANAVLRYRLYAIDQIISRTVTYGLVVAVLVAVYGTGVVALGWVVSSVAPAQGGAAVVAASTLAVAALFRPVRRVVQRVVDRRFNRTAYDARRSVDAFSHGLRDEVDLGQIADRLVTVASEALQPAHASLWLAEPAKER